MRFTGTPRTRPAPIVAKVEGERAPGRSLRVEETQPLKHDRGCERGKEWRDVPLGDEEAVRQPNHHAKRHRRREDHGDHGIVGSGEAGGDDRGGRHDGRDRKIDAPDQQDEGLAQHDDAERRGLGEDVRQQFSGLRKAGDKNENDQSVGDQEAEQAVFAEQLPGRKGVRWTVSRKFAGSRFARVRFPLST